MNKCKEIQTYDWDRLEPVLYESNENDTVYVYRLGSDNRPVKPYLTKCGLFRDFDFLTWLRDTHGGGEYQLLIRRGRKMIFSGYIGIDGRGSYQ